ncbi:XTP/dITP diphosphohydrolase [Brockia lithotrophica]|uniref:dITP/XTP pyrophosphatase n=2 Tax=Brockia lithotrophica TaxID=933949 RepID=A0A660KVV4_9BACL|nr:XTP/dITP diphosphohydrolase [Brockia lithotrophica]
MSRPRLMRLLLIASQNPGKIREVRELLASLAWGIVSLERFPDVKLPPETGETFAENAVRKAIAAMEATGLPSLADDSGLVVPALGGRPGVRSARYAGEGADDAANVAKLLAEMRGVADRRAYFVSVVAFAAPGEPVQTFEGRLEGVITEEPRGTGGFGYDPVFYVPDLGKTLAEVPLEVKNAISHRGQALRAFVDYLKRRIAEEPPEA